ncbi:hypothetical protein KFL_002000070 [Klebsormidium nitens]|uniref:Uncharacterized protein n=1 Tax=Klebsormidium nitens TaxID=105231 RepID=A0A1Y1I6A2_KLENI|nr:hypothetical protein KFL_002000070 [Klebsormidium nitens]|eukprot:GAQ84671.1 hypothetical protein KFL_002000070 [Klebsormidium nitens]
MKQDESSASAGWARPPPAMGDTTVAHQTLSDAQRSCSDAQRDVSNDLSAGSDSGDSGVRPEDADEIFDEFWSLPPEQVGTQLKTLEEAERSRRGSRASSFRYESDQEAPGKRDRGIVRLASDVVKKLKEAEEELAKEIDEEAERDAIQTEVSEVAERAAESGDPPGEIVREMESRWGGEMTEEERKALERLTQYQDWPGGINWGVPGGRVDQVRESHNPGLPGDQSPGYDNPGGQGTETKVVAVPPGEVDEDGSKEPVEAQPSPTSPLGFDFDAEAGESSAGTDTWSPTIGWDSPVSAVSGGDQGTLKRVDSWYEKSVTGKAKDVMESIVKGWWMQFPEWPGLAS